MFENRIVELFRNGILERCQGPLASNIVIICHKCARYSVRCCCDWGINACKWLLLLTYTQHRGNYRCTEWWTLDLRAGYYNVPVDEGDPDKTAIITRRGLFIFQKMPFRPPDVPGTFQHLMDIVFSGLNYSALAYLDNMLVCRPSVVTLIERFEEVVNRL